MGDVELPQAAKEAPGRARDSVAGIAAHALPSVVTLHVRGSQEEGTGTGFVLDSQGHILTNNHVIEPAGSGGEISVTFSGGETAKASVVGHDSGYDLAVVKVSGVSGLEPMPLGNSDNVQVGDPVVAIGAPFDLANTVTSGIISAKERPITAGGEKGDGSDVSYVDALQTDAPINPGNSGGPLLDSKARVIGINSAIRSADSGSDLESGQAEPIGLGFAIPINQGKRVAEELINTGKATHPVIGVTLDMDYTGDGARVGAKGNGGGPPVTMRRSRRRGGHQGGRHHHRGRRRARPLGRGTHREDPRPPPRRPAPADPPAGRHGKEGHPGPRLRRRRLTRTSQLGAISQLRTANITENHPRTGTRKPLDSSGRTGSTGTVGPGPDHGRLPRAADRGHRKELPGVQ